jgi:Tfp pilus assembly protein PilE
MLADRTGAELVEWIVVVVIVIAVLGTSVYTLFQTIGNKANELNSSIH